MLNDRRMIAMMKAMRRDSYKTMVAMLTMMRMTVPVMMTTAKVLIMLKMSASCIN